MTHALNIVWNPSEGIDLGFYNSFLQPYVCNCLWSRMVHHEKHLWTWGQSIEKLDSFVWTVLATLLGARLGHVFFYDWEYFHNHLIEILLPVRENSGSLFGFITGWEFTGYQGLAVMVLLFRL
jgi:prolipoprotein diacylglyceryltransferase